MATQMIVPILGESIQEATLTRWLKAAGEPVRRGEEIAEIETAKASMTLECPANGVLLEIRAALGRHFVGFNTGRWDYINSVAEALQVPHAAARAMACSSARTFPGQPYWFRRCNALGEMPTTARSSL